MGRNFESSLICTLKPKKTFKNFFKPKSLAGGAIGGVTDEPTVGLL